MISVITITYNNYDELIETLDSIKEVKEIESVVINGGTCEKTKKFLETYRGITLTETDRGISDAFNKGIKLSTGEALMFLNSGDKLIDPTYIDHVNSLLKTNTEIDYIYSDIIYNDTILGPIRIDVSNRDNNLARGMPYPHQSLIVRKQIFDQIGGFDTNLKIAMDFDLILRMFKNGFNQKQYIPKASVLMDGTGVSSTQELNCIIETKLLLKKYKLLSTRNLLRINLSLLFFHVKKNDFLKLISKKLRHKINY